MRVQDLGGQSSIDGIMVSFPATVDAASVGARVSTPDDAAYVEALVLITFDGATVSTADADEAAHGAAYGLSIVDAASQLPLVSRSESTIVPSSMTEVGSSGNVGGRLALLGRGDQRDHASIDITSEFLLSVPVAGLPGDDAVDHGS